LDGNPILRMSRAMLTRFMDGSAHHAHSPTKARVGESVADVVVDHRQRLRRAQGSCGGGVRDCTAVASPRLPCCGVGVGGWVGGWVGWVAGWVAGRAGGWGGAGWVGGWVGVGGVGRGG
jgi:hypothetical protein